MHEQPLRVFIGLDEDEVIAARVCERSMRNSMSPDGPSVYVEPLYQPALRLAGLYQRHTFLDHGSQHYDTTDLKPYSTQFSFTRFLVPALCQWSGWALFCDSDFLWRADVRDLFMLADESKAVMCVKHEHEPPESVKMRHGQKQTRYRRKNWSSLVLWNCWHPANRLLTPHMVNVSPGSWLHAFSWVPDADIGALPEQWNWLEGHSAPTINPAAVHYTRGTPDIPGMEEAPHAADWFHYAEMVRSEAA